MHLIGTCTQLVNKRGLSILSEDGDISNEMLMALYNILVIQNKRQNVLMCGTRAQSIYSIILGVSASPGQIS